MKKILYVDMDNVLVDFTTGIVQLDDDTRQNFEGRLDEVPGIFALMKPVNGAIEAYTRLANVFDTYVLSTSPWENPSAWHDKLQWVKRHLKKVAWKRLILSHHKNLNAGDFLVDDRRKNGAGEFGGELIEFGIEPFKDWVAVERYLMSKA